MQSAQFKLPTPVQISELVNVWAAANPVFAAALKNGSSVAEALGRLGFRLCGEDRVADAIDVFRAAVAIEPGNPSFWLGLAVALDQIGLLPDAAGCLEHSLGISDKQPAAWILLGAVRTKLGDLAGAQAAYQESLRLDGESPLAWQCLGSVNQQQGDLVGAIECFSACAVRGGTTAGVLGNLGRLHYQVGQFAESTKMYASALQLDKGNCNYQQMLRRAQLLRELCDGPVEEAIAGYLRSLPADAPEAERDMNAVLQNAVKMLSGFGHRDAAVRAGKQWLALAPESAAADYLLKAMTGHSGIERSPPEYVVEYFDGLSEAFDEKLVNVLRYDLPSTLCTTLKRVADAGRQFDTLDMGCGTGLCGPLLKPISRELIGVDLSPKMLERARRREAYNSLYCEDLLAFLQRSAGRFDLIVAADVLIYFGDLRPVWAGVRNALKPDGLVAFSTESAAGAGYELQSSGRFAHSLEYVRSTIANLLDERAVAEITIREEAAQPVRGHLFVLKKVLGPFYS
jgi:predicted TPR repeat methyltransferase